MQIKAQKHGTMNESDRLALAALLVKAGYRVVLRNVKVDGGGNRSEYVVEAEEM
ncbi:hypothetical protein AGMMS49975_25850 [Clostridia bacterium]|nr:hypothetical protein AGMMS49975_25850 [Clostridia bacterium]